MLRVIEPKPKLILYKGKFIGRLLDSQSPALLSERDRNLQALDFP